MFTTVPRAIRSIVLFLLTIAAYAMLAFGALAFSADNTYDLTAAQIEQILPTRSSIVLDPKEPAIHEPLVMQLQADVPAGAEVHGNGWHFDDGTKTIAKDVLTHYVWATPGKHVATYNGIWLNFETITVVIKGGGEREIRNFLGAGSIDARVEFTVGEAEDDDEDEDDPPPPPVEDARFEVMFFYESEDLDNLAPDQQALLRGRVFRRQLDEAAHEFRGCFEKEEIVRTSCSTVRGAPCVETLLRPELREWWDAAAGKAMPLMAIKPINRADDQVTVYQLPQNSDELFAFLKDQP